MRSVTIKRRCLALDSDNSLTQKARLSSQAFLNCDCATQLMKLRKRVSREVREAETGGVWHETGSHVEEQPDTRLALPKKTTKFH
jgi:hypothetical protein